MTTYVRSKIIRYFLTTAVLALLIGGPLSTIPSTYAGGCPTVGQDCTGG